MHANFPGGKMSYVGWCMTSSTQGFPAKTTPPATKLICAESVMPKSMKELM